MPRPSKPWWWAARDRWAATVGGRRIIAPSSIGRKDEHAAWAWHAEISDGPSVETTSTVDSLCEAYLVWDEARIEVGQRDRRAHENTCSVARRACAAMVGGVRFGSMSPLEVQPDHLPALIAAWTRSGASPGYRRSMANILKIVFRWASRRVDGRSKLIAASPFADVPLPTIPRPADRYANRDEAAAWLRWLWRNGHRKFAQLQRCLIHTGARPSELTRARWGEIKWNGERPAILTRADWKAARKTGRPRRVFVPRRLHRMLRRAEGASGVLVFPSPRGGQWTPSHLSVTTARRRREAIADGVPLSDEGPDRLTCYRWRHTAASSLLMSSVPVATVAELLGTSPQQIAATYGHLLSDHLADAADVLVRRRL